MEPTNPLIHQPAPWAELIQAQMRQSESGAISVTLQAINALIMENHIPRVNHFQFLLYVVLVPSDADDLDTAFVPSALTLLYRLLSIHAAGTLAPLIPSVECKQWLDWPGDADNLRGYFSRRVRARMENCRSDGVWSLLYKRTKRERAEEKAKWDEWRDEDTFNSELAPGDSGAQPRRRSKSRSRRSRTGDRQLDNDDSSDQEEDDEGDEEDDEDELWTRSVEPTAWELLPFLIALWEKDCKENDGVPVAFLWQFWRPSPDLQYDQMGSVVGILGEAVYNCPASEASARHRIAASLLYLLIQAATGDQPSIIPRQLVANLLPLFRHPRVAVLIGTMRSLLPAYGYRSIPTEAITHLLSHAIEHAAGVRTKREAARRGGSRNGRRRARNVPVPAHFEDGNLAPPLVEYAISLLDLEPEEDPDDPDDMTKAERQRNMQSLKIALVAALVRIRPSELWYDVENPRYAPIIRAMLPGDDTEETEPTLLRESLARERDSPDGDIPMSQAELEEAAQEDALDEEMGGDEDEEMDDTPSQDAVHDEALEEEDAGSEDGDEDDGAGVHAEGSDDIDIEITAESPVADGDSLATEPTQPLSAPPKRQLRNRRSSAQADGLRRSARLAAEDDDSLPLLS